MLSGKIKITQIHLNRHNVVRCSGFSRPDFRLHGIRGKAGRKAVQAFVRNKGSRYRFAN